MVSKFSGLLKDSEADVRVAAVNNLKNCTKIVSPDKLATILLPPLSSVALDSSALVRSGLADALGEISMSLGKEATIQKIVPIAQDLIKDENHDVKLNLINSIMKIASITGPEVLTGPILLGFYNLLKEN